MMLKPNVLVIYGFLDYPIRTSVKDLIYAFHNNPKCNAFIYSIEQGPFPDYLKNVKFDLVLFSTILLGERWGGQQKMYNKVYPLLEYFKDLDTIKIIHPQDEWIHTEVLNNFINDFKISHVFSVAPESEWKKIYNKVDFAKIKFYRVLTGYLEENTVKKIDAITLSAKLITDIGYRAYKSPPWLGSHGYLKTRIAEVFKAEAPKKKFSVDISTEVKDTIMGDEWLKFMASCRYFIGAEGGSTVIDPDGSVFKKGLEFQKLNPKATFEEFEKNCFPGMDGNLNLVAISPRHLEACVAKTCQVLVEGSYNEILKPGIHYIEVKSDFSNLEEVFNQMKNESLRKTIVDTAYRDIVASKKYSYLTYTDFIIDKSLGNVALKQKKITDKVILLRNRISNRRFWKNKCSRQKQSVLEIR